MTQGNESKTNFIENIETAHTGKVIPNISDSLIALTTEINELIPIAEDYLYEYVTEVKVGHRFYAHKSHLEKSRMSAYDYAVRKIHQDIAAGVYKEVWDEISKLYPHVAKLKLSVSANNIENVDKIVDGLEKIMRMTRPD